MMQPIRLRPGEQPVPRQGILSSLIAFITGSKNQRRTTVAVKYYRNNTRQGTDKYAIEYAWNGSHYDLYAHSRPSNPYSSGVSTTHLYENSSQICVSSGREPKTMDQAEKIARAFMDHFSQYVRDGKGLA